MHPPTNPTLPIKFAQPGLSAQSHQYRVYCDEIDFEQSPKNPTIRTQKSIAKKIIIITAIIIAIIIFVFPTRFSQLYNNIKHQQKQGTVSIEANYRIQQNGKFQKTNQNSVNIDTSISSIPVQKNTKSTPPNNNQKNKKRTQFEIFFDSKCSLLQAKQSLKEDKLYSKVVWEELGNLDTVDMTAVFTTSGRTNQLLRTLQSFFKFNSHPLKKVIVVHDGPRTKQLDQIINIFGNITWLITNIKIGQLAAIDQAYRLIETQYYFHSEDDWQYERPGFIEYSVQALNYDPKLNGLHITHIHPYAIPPFQIGSLRIITQLHTKKYSGHSLNPSGHRMQDYRLLEGGFSGASFNLSFASGAGQCQQIISQIYTMKGYHYAQSPVQFVKHIGNENPSPWKFWLQSFDQRYNKFQKSYQQWQKDHNDKQKQIESLMYLLPSGKNIVDFQKPLLETEQQRKTHKH